MNSFPEPEKKVVVSAAEEKKQSAVAAATAAARAGVRAIPIELQRLFARMWFFVLLLLICIFYV